MGDIVDVTAIHDIGQRTYDSLCNEFIAFGRDGSLVLINVGDIASALGSGGLGLAASGSVLLDANGTSYASQVALLLKAVPGLGNFLAWSDERKFGWYEDALKGFDSVFGKQLRLADAGLAGGEHRVDWRAVPRFTMPGQHQIGGQPTQTIE
jgi:hypothetical protein